MNSCPNIEPCKILQLGCRDGFLKLVTATAANTISIGKGSKLHAMLRYL
jgi:hypothetical protein